MLLLISEELHTQFFFPFPEGFFQNEPFDLRTTNLFGTWGTHLRRSLKTKALPSTNMKHGLPCALECFIPMGGGHSHNMWDSAVTAF
jgi:hypothetical protein